MILILGGIHESFSIAKKLSLHGQNVVLSVATELGLQTYSAMKSNSDTKDLRIIQERFTMGSLKAFIHQENIDILIDATHPHASEISQIAEEVVETLFENKVELIRFARKSIDVDIPRLEYDSFEDFLIAHDPRKTKVLSCQKNTHNPFEQEEIHFKREPYSTKQALKSAERVQYQSIQDSISSSQYRYLITGVKHIREIFKVLPKENCFFRIMPSEYSIREASQNGVLLSNIIAIKTPVSKELNKAILREFDIDYFVMKDSGDDSAFLSNLESTVGEKAKAIVIKRPKSENMFTYSEDEIVNKVLYRRDYEIRTT